jgi:hypothetical protein
LKEKRVRNPPEMWVRKDNAFDALVETDDYLAAQAIILERHRRLSNEELLERLKALAERLGSLSGILIDETDDMPSSAVYRHRFGSLVRAYQLIGYTPARDLAFIETNRRLRQLHPQIVDGIVRSLEQLGGNVTRDPETDLLSVNAMLWVSVVIARCRKTDGGSFRWLIRLDEGLTPDLTVAVRMDPANEAALDYYLLPSLDVGAAALRIKEDNGMYLDGYRFDTLDYFFGMAETVPVEEAA